MPDFTTHARGKHPSRVSAAWFIPLFTTNKSAQDSKRLRAETLHHKSQPLDGTAPARTSVRVHGSRHKKVALLCTQTVYVRFRMFFRIREKTQILNGYCWVKSRCIVIVWIIVEWSLDALLLGGLLLLLSEVDSWKLVLTIEHFRKGNKGICVLCWEGLKL